MGFFGPKFRRMVGFLLSSWRFLGFHVGSKFEKNHLAREYISSCWWWFLPLWLRFMIVLRKNADASNSGVLFFFFFLEKRVLRFSKIFSWPKNLGMYLLRGSSVFWSTDWLFFIILLVPLRYTHALRWTYWVVSTNFATLRYVPGNLCSPLTDPYLFHVSDPSAVARGLKCSPVTLHFSSKQSDDFQVSFNFQTLF